MRTSWLLVALALAGSAAKAQDDTKEREAFLRRYDSLAALVDTIVVLSPDSIVLHVGQSEGFGLLGYIRAEARRASGEVVRGTGQAIETLEISTAVEDTSIAADREAGLTGVKVGRTRVVVTLEVPLQSRKKVHVHPSYVPIVVIP